MSTHKPATARTVAVLAVLVVIAACSSADSIESTDAGTTTNSGPPTSEPVATSAAASTTVAETTLDTSTTTEAPASTVPETTTTEAVATTTEAPLAPAGLTLARNGVLPFLLGDIDTQVISGLSTALGAPIFDTANTYTIPDGDYLLDATEEEGYLFPVGRFVCFSNDLCVQFGGATTDSLTFTGWSLDSNAAPQLFTSDGITVGTNLADVPGIVTVQEGGCYSTGYGETAGVSVTLFSSGELFLLFDENGEYQLGNPALGDITVSNMSAGELPFFLYDDC
jgi:hypothetical protein